MGKADHGFFRQGTAAPGSWAFRSQKSRPPQSGTDIPAHYKRKRKGGRREEEGKEKEAKKERHKELCSATPVPDSSIIISAQRINFTTRTIYTTKSLHRYAEPLFPCFCLDPSLFTELLT